MEKLYVYKIGKITRTVGSIEEIPENIEYQELILQEEIFVNVEELNKQQYLELRPTDWYFIRKAETGEEVPEEIILQRILIREKYNNLKK